MAPLEQDAYQLLRRPLPGMYRCTVRVKDEPGSDRLHIAGSADVLVGPGESAEKTSTFGPFRMHFRASLSESLDRAVTAVTIHRGEDVVHRQTSTVWLQRPRN